MDKAVEVLDRIYKPKDKGILFMEKSFEFMKSEDIDNAVMFSDISRKYFEKFKNLGDIKNIEINLSKHLIDANSLDFGEKYLKRAKSIVENYESYDNIEMYIAFIKLYLKKKELAKAGEYLKRFQKVIDIKNISNFLEFYSLKYELYILQEEYREAEDTINFICNFCIEFGEYKRAGNFYLKLYKLYVDIEKFKEAEDAIVKAKVQYDKSGCKILF